MTRSHIATPIFALVALIATELGAQSARPPLPVIPAPASAVAAAGTWSPSAPLPRLLTVASDAELARVGIRVRLVATDTAAGLESYRLSVSPAGVELTAPRAAGRFYGLVTLQQMVDAARLASSTVQIPAVLIADAPSFPYRGLHLDVGRHFQPVEFVKRYIDLMALYKLNTFHWHLTEDQGWRIEIKKYPRLTAVGGCRAETMVEKQFTPYVGDGTPHCGFYTQEEIREVVAYAAERHVTVIPEIEMPGHSVAALTAYPELACTPGPFTVRTTWGVADDIFCPSERTFAFLEDVLTEVIELFPSRYIHIGGDEAPKVRWKESALAQAVIKREGLKDEHELQSWFIRRIERFLLTHQRRLIGWDEILEGGLAPQATVMSWRGVSGGIEAAQQGHDVIMTPTSHLYLDFYQGDSRFEPLAIGGLLTLERVYSFEPIPDVLTADQRKHILGAQGNVWTEYLKTPAAVEYMAYPRAIALAEVTWSPRERRDWPDFLSRLPHALRTLDGQGVNYRLPHVEGLDRDMLTLAESLPIALSVPIEGATIHYTLDGSDPTKSSVTYVAPFHLPVSSEGVRLTARAFTTDGKASPPRSAAFRRTSFRESESIDAASLIAGLRYTYVEESLRSASGADTLVATRSGTSSQVARRGDERAEQYALRFDGYLRIPSEGLYEFALTSDDGSLLDIGDTRVVDNDGLHGTAEKRGMIALFSGLHPIVVRYFQAGGGAELSLRVRLGAGAWQEIPPDWLLQRR